MNKFLIVSVLLVLVVFVTGCAMKKSADTAVKEPAAEATTEQANTGKFEYIVTTVIPTKAMDGVKDPAEPGYVPINPNYDINQRPKDKAKIEWFKTGLGAKVPPVAEGNIMEVINTDDQFVVYIVNVPQNVFGEFLDSFFKNGFEGARGSWESQTFFNKEIAVNTRYMQEQGLVSTIRARVLKKGEYEKMKEAMNKKLEMMNQKAGEAAANKDEKAAAADTAKKEQPQQEKK